MAMNKKTPPPIPNPNKMKINNALTLLGQVTGSWKNGDLRRKPFTDSQLKELKAMIAAADAARAKAAKDAKKNAKIIKQQNKTPLRPGRGATKPITVFDPPKKPVIKVGPRGGGVGGMLGGGGAMEKMFKR